MHASATESEDNDMMNPSKQVMVREYGIKVGASISNRIIPSRKSTLVEASKDQRDHSERTKIANERGSG